LPHAETNAAQAPPPYDSQQDTAEPLDAKMLLVDDDNAVREVTASMLRELGYNVVEAGSGGTALYLWDREAKNVDLIIIDLAMPGMSGADVARLAQAKRPGLPTLFVTGFADRAALAGVSDAQIIGKPFVNAELANKVRAALLAATPRTSSPLRR
jgi:CheY-like chemotaxis protein